LLDEYCVSCHNERLKTGELVLTDLDLSDLARNGPLLEKVVKKLRGGTMPPDGKPRPDQATLKAFITSLEAALDAHAQQTPDPGRVASRRLNRTEYVNAIYDMLGLEVNGAELLPNDMAGFGFDNNADVLTITPSLMTRYIAAATKISRTAVGSPDIRPITQVYQLGFENRTLRANDDMPFATKGGLAVRHSFPLDGEYVFKIRLKRDGTVSTIEGIDEDEHQIELRVDHEMVKQFQIGGKFKGPDPGLLIAVPEDDKAGQQLHEYRMNADNALEVRLPMKAGTRLVAAGFTDAAPSPERMTRGRGFSFGGGDANTPGIDVLSIAGPFDGKIPEDTPSRRKIFVCRPDSARAEEGCARRILTTLATRAYRRPATDDDIRPLLAIYREGRSARDFDAGIERALEALLSSPKFLLRFERVPATAARNPVYRLSDLDLASRLSFFLWRSIPDDELIELAAKNQLSAPATLTAQVRRMLADRRALRFTKDFTEQWLEIRNLDTVKPVSPMFDEALRRAMAKETELFIESQFRDDRPIQDLLRANYTYLNEPLARHYGIPNINGNHFRRVTMTDERRQGLLAHASVLTVTSYADRTSVVLRGKWVLENLLGSPPPPPPPNVPPLKQNDGKSLPKSLRERMEQHRATPVCSNCHSRMDPLGFALEHYSAIGQYRETDSGAAINSTIVLGGQTIDGLRAFREALLTQTDEYVHTVAEKLLIYSLGRGLTSADAPTVRQLVRDLERNEYRWSALVMGIVQSTPFRMQRTPEPAAPQSAAAVH
jgi:hypothetical protein